MNDYELNNLEYKEAIKFNKRTYSQYYFSLLKTRHIIIFTFYTRNDYNSKEIKIILFLFSFSLYLTVNALFFDDKAIHKINEKPNSFFYQIPQILYSTIITSLVNIIIKHFSLSEKAILDIKKDKNMKENKESNRLNKLIARFMIFFILTFVFLILFWHYLSCFCAVDKNTQTYLIKNTLVSYGLSLIYPFGLNLLPGIFRIPSLKNKNKGFLYNISIIIQSI